MKFSITIPKEGYSGDPEQHWEVRDGHGVVAFGEVVHRKFGMVHCYVSNVCPEHRRKGIYSGVVLPALAKEFGIIYSDTLLSPGAVAAWKKAKAREIQPTLGRTQPTFCLEHQ